MTEIYKNTIPSELQGRMTPKEIKGVESSIKQAGFLFFGSALLGLAWAITLIMWLIWMNKFTLFIFGSSSIVFVFASVLTVWQIKVHAKDIKKLIETLKERE